MALGQRLMRFVRKSSQARRVTIRYFARRGLSRVSFLPVRVWIRMSPSEVIHLWWSSLPAEYQPDRALREYWGKDVGELRFLWQFLRPGQTFVDVGAHHGIYSIYASKKLRNQGRVIAFEPSPRERRRLNLHLKMNGISSVTVEPYAAGARNGWERLFVVQSGFTTMNSLRSPALDSVFKEIQVETRGLDEYVKERNLTELDLLKIDTEGAELEVLAGAQSTLQRFRPVIICEVLDWVTKPWGYPAREIVSHLASQAYYWFEFRPDGTLQSHIPEAEYPAVKNYLAVPREKLNLVQNWVMP